MKFEKGTYLKMEEKCLFAYTLIVKVIEHSRRSFKAQVLHDTAPKGINLKGKIMENSKTDLADYLDDFKIEEISKEKALIKTL